MTVSLTCPAPLRRCIGNRFEMVIADTQCPEMVDRVDHVVLVGTRLTRRRRETCESASLTDSAPAYCR
jgi:cytochrome P450